MDQHLNEWPAEERRPYHHPYPGPEPSRRPDQGRTMALIVAVLGVAGIVLAAVLVVLGVKAW